MFELKRQLNEQIELTTIFFDAGDAKRAREEAQSGGDYDKPELREITMEQFVNEAREAGCDDFEVFERLKNEVDGFAEIERKAHLYDKMVEARRRGAEKANAVSADERKARAIKAAKARWAK